MLRLLAVLCWLAGPALGAAAEPVAIPPLSARVTDLTGTLSAERKATLDGALSAIEQEKGTQVAILMLPTTQPETIEQFGIRLAEAWKVGRRGVNDGAIIIVAKDDHKMRIEVGYGLEGAVPDAIAKRIISEVMSPRFKQGDFAGGLDSAVAALRDAIAGEPLPAPAAKPPGGESPEWNAGQNNFIYLFFALLLGGILRPHLGLIGVVGAAAAAGWFAWTIFSSWLAVAIAAALSLIFGFMGNGFGDWSRGGSRSSSGGGFSSSSGGSSSSSSSGSSWSGGGGDFGGGGSSGDW
jgi:uncharacterized protein